MTEHDWQPIAPPEDNGIMCTVCFECKCCSDWTDECPGEWVPSDERVKITETQKRLKVARGNASYGGTLSSLGAVGSGEMPHAREGRSDGRPSWIGKGNW